MTGHSEAPWLAKALRVLALALRHEVALTRTVRGDGRQEGFMGLLLTADEAEAMLAEASGRLRASGTAVSAAALEELEAQLEAERPGMGEDPFCQLAQQLDLDPPEVQLLLMAAAAALDPRFGAVYGYLNDDMTRRHLTPELAARLLEHRGGSLAQVRQLLDPAATLCTSGVLQVGAARPWIQTPIRLDELLLDRLLGLTPSRPLPAGHGFELRLTASKPTNPKPSAPGIWLVTDSPDGHGALLALQTASATASGMLLLHLSDHPGPAEALTGWLRSMLREARLRGLLPVLRGFDALDLPLRIGLAGILRPPLLVLAATPLAWQDALLPVDPPAELTLTRTAALDLLLSGHAADSPQLRDWLNRLQHLDPLLLARLLHTHHDQNQLRAALRQRLAQPLARLAEPLQRSDSLTDLVLPSRARRALEELATWHATGPTVRKDWDFGRVFGRGIGTTALFKGPSGTGKTMAAAAVGNALQLPVFRVNLAGLVSKYIGETEKNLDRLFDAADGSDVVLFFDEADAVFGKRSEVHDAHDRYANLETAYLLQRIEGHAGICILASNLHQNIDEAFVRRIDVIVDFPTPGPVARQHIWQRLALGRAALEPGIDFGLLAERFELTGGEIRNCALAAAHLAAADGQVITMNLLMQAIGRELAKAGKPIRRSDFGSHYGGLRGSTEGS